MRIVVMGATAGIGLATAELLAGEGAEVIVTGRDPERLAAVKDRVAQAEAVEATDEQALARFFAQLGSIDHLVLAFSPGAVGAGPVRDIGLADVRAMFDGKFFPYLHAVQQAVRHDAVRGSITFVSAASARAAVPGTVTFASVNGAIERMVSPLAAELAPIRVNAVSPGLVDTHFWDFLPTDVRAAQYAAAANMVPANRVATAEDVARAIRYLIGAEYVTGSILPVDGGYTVA